MMEEIKNEVDKVKIIESDDADFVIGYFASKEDANSDTEKAYNEWKKSSHASSFPHTEIEQREKGWVVKYFC